MPSARPALILLAQRYARLGLPGDNAAVAGAERDDARFAERGSKVRRAGARCPSTRRAVRSASSSVLAAFANIVERGAVVHVD